MRSYLDAGLLHAPASDVQTKPHGHGDVHTLLHASGLLPRFAAEGRTHVVLFQDTNALAFKASKVFCMWVSWREMEPTEGEYSFAALDANFDAAVGRGWSFALRLLTSRVAEAPLYLANRSIRTLDGGSRGPNYDPSDPAFHARYLALVAALRSHGLCQRPELASRHGLGHIRGGEGGPTCCARGAP